MIIFAVFNCFTIPVQVAFEPKSMSKTWFVIMNFMIDFCFLLDIIVTFRVAYIDDFGQEVNEPKLIAINYLKG